MQVSRVSRSTEQFQQRIMRLLVSREDKSMKDESCFEAFRRERLTKILTENLATATASVSWELSSHSTEFTDAVLEGVHQFFSDLYQDRALVCRSNLGSQAISGDVELESSSRDFYYVGNDSDCMIHKNLRAFLLRELESYTRNQLPKLDGLLSASDEYRKNTLLCIKLVGDLCTKIIDLLAQAEDLAKILLEKKRLVLRTEYCLTLDRVPEELWDQVLKNESQVEEWRQLYALDESTPRRLIDHEFLRRNRSIMIDTRHFPDEFKQRLLNALHSIDDQTDGLVVMSENLQAICTLRARYGSQIKCIYIDPPYNTKRRGRVYRDKYQPSHWLTMMKDRLETALHLMTDDGLIFVSVDDNQLFHLKLLMDATFQSENFVSMICHQHRKSLSNDLIISPNHNALLLYAKSERLVYHKRSDFRLPASSAAAASYLNDGGDGRGPYKWVPTDGPGGARKGNPYFEFMGVSGYFRYSKETMQKLYDEGELRVTSGNIQRKHYLGDVKGQTASTWWNDVGTTTDGTRTLKAMFGQKVYTNPKPLGLIERILQLSTSESDTVLDFFAGSGTTAHAVISQNRQDGGRRKYILVEKEKWLEDVLLPRIKKAVLSEEWKHARPVSNSDTGLSSHMLKVLYLESIDDSVGSLALDGSAETTAIGEGSVLWYTPDTTDGRVSCRLGIVAITNPFDCRMKVATAHGVSEKPVDIVETFNVLLGVHITEIRDFMFDGRHYKAIAGEKDGINTIVVWRPLSGIAQEADTAHRDRAAIEESIVPTMLNAIKPYRLFVNGYCEVENSEPLEPELDRLMFGRD